MPFTSTALIARELGKPTCYYDPTGLVQKDDRAAHGIEIVSGREELAHWLGTVARDAGQVPPAGGLEAAYRADLEAADDPAAKLAEIKARLEQVRSPFRTAEKFGIEDIIDPRDTRPLLCEFVDHAYRVLEPGPVAKGWRC